MPDMTVTLDMLDWVRSRYDLSFLPGLDEERLWRAEKYLIYRLERAGIAAPVEPLDEQEPEDGADPSDEYDYLHELTQPDTGGSD